MLICSNWIADDQPESAECSFVIRERLPCRDRHACLWSDGCTNVAYAAPGLKVNGDHGCGGGGSIIATIQHGRDFVWCFPRNVHPRHLCCATCICIFQQARSELYRACGEDFDRGEEEQRTLSGGAQGGWTASQLGSAPVELQGWTVFEMPSGVMVFEIPSAPLAM